VEFPKPLNCNLVHIHRLVHNRSAGNLFNTKA
jgi:hypothetical protein